MQLKTPLSSSLALGLAIGAAGTLAALSGSSSQAQVVQPTASPSALATPSASPSLSANVSIDPGAMGKGPQAYGPNPLVVLRGATVTWTNNDSLPHTVTADDGSFGSGSLSQGQTFQHTFSQAGTFPYFCTIHGKASMSGAVQVVEGGASPSPSPSPSATQSPGTGGGTGGGSPSY